MSPKQKAEELIGKCYDTFVNDEDEHYNVMAWRISKQCALIAVDEVMYQLNVLPYGMEYLSHIDYWEEVKQEIQKL